MSGAPPKWPELLTPGNSSPPWLWGLAMPCPSTMPTPSGRWVLVTWRTTRAGMPPTGPWAWGWSPGTCSMGTPRTGPMGCRAARPVEPCWPGSARWTWRSHFPRTWSPSRVTTSASSSIFTGTMPSRPSRSGQIRRTWRAERRSWKCFFRSWTRSQKGSGPRWRPWQRPFGPSCRSWRTIPVKGWWVRPRRSRSTGFSADGCWSNPAAMVRRPRPRRRRLQPGLPRSPSPKRIRRRSVGPRSRRRLPRPKRPWMGRKRPWRKRDPITPRSFPAPKRHRAHPQRLESGSPPPGKPWPRQRRGWKKAGVAATWRGRKPG